MATWAKVVVTEMVRSGWILDICILKIEPTRLVDKLDTEYVKKRNQG